MEIRSIRSTRSKPEKDVALVSDLTPLDLLNLAFTGKFNHLIQREQANTIREIRVARLMSQQPRQFLDFPISSLLAPRRSGHEWESQLTLMEWSLTTLTDKPRILMELGDLFEQSNLNPTLRDDVVLAADEFCCNVLFNAVCPQGVNSKALVDTLRTADKVLVKPARLRIGAYNGLFALTCWDAYGSLNPMRVLDRLRQCLKKGAEFAMNMRDSGTAGIGSFLVFNACTSLAMVVEKDVGTVICALFPLHKGAKVRGKMPKNLHWIDF